MTLSSLQHGVVPQLAEGTGLDPVNVWVRLLPTLRDSPGSSPGGGAVVEAEVAEARGCDPRLSGFSVSLGDVV